MSVASFVASSIDELHAGRYDVALALACAAVDATAAKSTNNTSIPNAKRFKTFLENNMRIITTFGFPGMVASGIRIKCYNVPDLKTDKNGYVSIADIIYHVVRCGLLHECSIDQRIEFVNETYIGDFNQVFRIPRNFIFGLLMAVILSCNNADQVFDRVYSETIDGASINLQNLWGRGPETMNNWHNHKIHADRTGGQDNGIIFEYVGAIGRKRRFARACSKLSYYHNASRARLTSSHVAPFGGSDGMWVWG